MYMYIVTYICTYIETQHLLPHTCQMEEGGVAALFVSAVDIFCGEQLLHAVEVAFLGRVEQSCVSSEQVRQVAVLLLDQVKRREVVPVATVDVRSTLHWRRVRGYERVVEYMYFGCTFHAHLQQQSADLVLALGSGFVERSELPQVHYIHSGHALHQLLCHFVVPVGARIVQGN